MEVHVTELLYVWVNRVGSLLGWAECCKVDAKQQSWTQPTSTTGADWALPRLSATAAGGLQPQSHCLPSLALPRGLWPPHCLGQPLGALRLCDDDHVRFFLRKLVTAASAAPAAAAASAALRALPSSTTTVTRRASGGSTLARSSCRALHC